MMNDTADLLLPLNLFGLVANLGKSFSREANCVALFQSYVGRRHIKVNVKENTVSHQCSLPETVQIRLLFCLARP